MILIFFFQAEDGIRDVAVTGVQTCALPISHRVRERGESAAGTWSGAAEGNCSASRSRRHPWARVAAVICRRHVALLVCGDSQRFPGADSDTIGRIRPPARVCHAQRGRTPERVRPPPPPPPPPPP